MKNDFTSSVELHREGAYMSCNKDELTEEAVAWISEKNISITALGNIRVISFKSLDQKAEFLTEAFGDPYEAEGHCRAQVFTNADDGYVNIWRDLMKVELESQGTNCNRMNIFKEGNQHRIELWFDCYADAHAFEKLSISGSIDSKANTALEQKKMLNSDLGISSI